MQRLTSPAGATVSWPTSSGRGPSSSCTAPSATYKTNWKFVATVRDAVHRLCDRSTRSGRNGRPQGQAASRMRAVMLWRLFSRSRTGFFLGHSYGAQTALARRDQRPGPHSQAGALRAAWPRGVEEEALALLEGLARAGSGSR